MSACSLAKKDSAKCLDTAQVVQKKLDFHDMPLLEPDPLSLQWNKKKKAWQKCISLTRCVWRPYEFQLTSHCWGGVRTVILRGLPFDRVAGSSRKIRNDFNAIRCKYELKYEYWVPTLMGPYVAKARIFGKENVKELARHCDCILLLDSNTFGNQQLNKLTHSYSVLKAGEKHHGATMFQIFLLERNTNTPLYKWLHNTRNFTRRSAVCVCAEKRGVVGWSTHKHTFSHRKHMKRQKNKQRQLWTIAQTDMETQVQTQANTDNEWDGFIVQLCQ